jgi:hypothetical protein
MTAVIVPAPSALNGDALTAELHAAGLPEAAVTLVGADLEVSGVDSGDRAKVEEVVAAHVPPPPQATPDDDLAARIQAVYDDPNVPDAVKKLAAALLGLNGEAAVAGRPTDTAR